jgi:UDP-N-acetylglucosamine--N-acetylmuramyl-(pentapeptide) pyrophosphoryl-undecaprenol N-acetylglucosamine transferase
MTFPPVKKVLIMAGGTGGHVFPALTIAKALLAQGAQVEWLGTRNGIEARVIGATRIPLHFISVSGLRGSGLLKKLLAPLVVVFALLQALLAIVRIKPGCVLGMGGFATGPGGVAAKLLGKKLLIHEQNAVAGLTNQLLFPLANTVMEAFPGAFERKQQLTRNPILRKFIRPGRVVVVGNPVREEILAIETYEQRFAARTGKLRLLVIGGSLGAVAINKALPQVLAGFSASDRPLVKHQCGSRNLEETRSWYQAAGVPLDDGIELSAFIDDMAAAYSWADVILCRAGASTLAEIAAIGLPSILVPYLHAVDDHQTANARVLQQIGAAQLLQQDESLASKLAAVLREIAMNRHLLLEQSMAARMAGNRNATAVAAQYCMEACHG